MDVGSTIREARIARRLSVAELADAAGVTRQAIALLEAGETHGRFQTIAKIARVLGLSLDLLVQEDRACAFTRRRRGMRIGKS